MNLFVMAWRNVWRNSRRSLITIAAMALALWTELIYSGLVTGMVADMVGDVTDYDLGDIQVFSKGWTNRPSLHETVEGVDPVPDRRHRHALRHRARRGGLPRRKSGIDPPHRSDAPPMTPPPTTVDPFVARSGPRSRTSLYAPFGPSLRSSASTVVGGGGRSTP